MSAPERQLRLTPLDAMVLAIQYHRSGKLADAERIYRAVVEADPEHVDALHFLGVLSHQQGKNDEAVALIRRALALNPGYTDARNNLGNVLRLTGRNEEAEAAYRLVLEHAPEHADAWNNLGTLLSHRGDREGAIRAYRRAIALREEHADAWENLAGEFRRAGRREESVKAFEKALRYRPADAAAHLNLGRALQILGQHDLAAKVYREWLEREPDHPVARHMVAASTGEGAPPRAADDFVRQTFDDFSRNFDEVLGSIDYRAPDFVAGALAEALPGNAGGIDILDAGCGTGLCGPLLRPMAKHLSGVDLSGGMLARAEARGVYDELAEAELTAFLDSHPDRYDAVVAADVLVYFGEIRPLLAAASGALRSGGHLVFTTEREEEASAPGGFRLSPHGRYGHTPGYVAATLQSVGLSLVSATEVPLRLEGGEPVRGTLTVAKK